MYLSLKQPRGLQLMLDLEQALQQSNPVRALILATHVYT